MRVVPMQVHWRRTSFTEDIPSAIVWGYCWGALALLVLPLEEHMLWERLLFLLLILVLWHCSVHESNTTTVVIQGTNGSRTLMIRNTSTTIIIFNIKVWEVASNWHHRKLSSLSLSIPLISFFIRLPFLVRVLPTTTMSPKLALACSMNIPLLLALWCWRECFSKRSLMISANWWFFMAL